MTEHKRAELCDLVWRSYGTLKYAQIMTTKEFMELASHIRLGISMGMITHISPAHLNRLTTDIQPANLQKICGKTLSPDQRDLERAAYLRKELENRKE